MTRDETIKVLSVLRGAYPQFYKDTSRQEALDAINLWSDMFTGDDFRMVSAAVKFLISADEKGFPPVIGQVKAYIRKISQPQTMTEGEAWSLLAKAIRNSIYASREEFEKLPEDVRQIVGAPSQLRDWATMDSGVIHSVVASNFQRSYRVKCEQDKQYNALPDDVKAMIGEVSRNFLLREGEDDCHG